MSRMTAGSGLCVSFIQHASMGRDITWCSVLQERLSPSGFKLTKLKRSLPSLQQEQNRNTFIPESLTEIIQIQECVLNKEGNIKKPTCSDHFVLDCSIKNQEDKVRSFQEVSFYPYCTKSQVFQVVLRPPLSSDLQFR